MVSTTQDLVTYSAIIIASVSLFVSIYFNSRTLKQSEKNLEIQLTHKDTNNALRRLSELVNEKSSHQKFHDDIKSFLSDFEGQFIPEDIKKLTLDRLYGLNEFYHREHPLKDPEPTEEELRENLEEFTREEMDRQKRLNPEEKFDEIYYNRLDSFKGTIISKIKVRLTKPIKN